MRELLRERRAVFQRRRQYQATRLCGVGVEIGGFDADQTDLRRQADFAAGDVAQGHQRRPALGPQHRQFDTECQRALHSDGEQRNQAAEDPGPAPGCGERFGESFAPLDRFGDGLGANAYRGLFRLRGCGLGDWLRRDLMGRFGGISF